MNNQQSEHQCPGSRPASSLLGRFLRAVGVGPAETGAGAGTPPPNPETSGTAEMTGSGSPLSSAPGAAASIIVQLQSVQAQLAVRESMLQSTEADAAVLRRSVAVYRKENRDLRHDLEEAVKLLGHAKAHIYEGALTTRREIDEFLERAKREPYARIVETPDRRKAGSGCRFTSRREIDAFLASVNQNKGGRPVGTGPDEAAAQAESTGETRSGETPRAPATLPGGNTGPAAPTGGVERRTPEPRAAEGESPSPSSPVEVSEEDRQPKRIRITINRQVVDVARTWVTADDIRKMHVPPVPDDHDVWQSNVGPPVNGDLLRDSRDFPISDGAKFYTAPKFINNGASAGGAVEVSDEDFSLATTFILDHGIAGPSDGSSRVVGLARLLARIRRQERERVRELVAKVERLQRYIRSIDAMMKIEDKKPCQPTAGSGKSDAR